MNAYRSNPRAYILCLRHESRQHPDLPDIPENDVFMNKKWCIDRQKLPGLLCSGKGLKWEMGRGRELKGRTGC